MSRVAFLTASCMIKDHPDARKDYWEHDLEMAALQPACKALGISLEPVIWDEPGLNPADYDAVMIGTVWDYMEKPQAFTEFLERCDRETRLLNPLPTVMWNMRKVYLKDLEARGAAMIPTLWGDKADEATILGAFDALGCDDVVVKPVLGVPGARRVCAAAKRSRRPGNSHRLNA